MILLLSSEMMISALPGQGLRGLIGGVNLKNTPQIFLSDLLIAAMLVFYNQGTCENYLYGYGKYCLLRHKDRKKLIFSIYGKAGAVVFWIIIARITLYSLLLVGKGEWANLATSEVVEYALRYGLVWMLFCCMQFWIEMKFSSVAGVLAVLFYYLYSVCGKCVDRRRTILVLLPFGAEFLYEKQSGLFIRSGLLGKRIFVCHSGRLFAVIWLAMPVSDKEKGYFLGGKIDE